MLVIKERQVFVNYLVPPPIRASCQSADLMAWSIPMNDQPTTQPDFTIEELIAAISHQIEVSHGGWVEFVNYDGKTLQVRLQGACVGCPMSQQTLALGIGRTCKQYFPELEYIQAVA
jgi:Fe-S cluster biogenesis protein NfuA